MVAEWRQRDSSQDVGLSLAVNTLNRKEIKLIESKIAYRALIIGMVAGIVMGYLWWGI